MNDDIVRFFYQSAHCKTEVMKNIVIDIDACCRTYSLKRALAPWGDTNQCKMCLYGGLHVSIASNKCVFPCQIWITSSFPIDPPVIYLIAQNLPDKVVKVHSNHQFVDCNGRCYCPELSKWNPKTSQLIKVLEGFIRCLRQTGISPFVMEDPLDKLVNSLSDSESNCCVVCYGIKNTVLIPCGHFCLCSSCAANVLDCPMCRAKIKLRQKVVG